jgi:hypothetical protein
MNTIVLETPMPRMISVLSFRLRVIELILGQSVKLAVFLECESGGKSFNDYKEVILEGDEYFAWGTDDTYIIETVKSKLESIL